jgi:hypothetical protein
MSLLDVLRSGVAIVDKVTRPLQATVSYEQCTSVDASGTKAYASAVPLKAVVDWKQRQVRSMSGVLSVSPASVMFLDILALVVATGGDGVDDKDRITLPDGQTLAILNMGGFIDAGTGKPVATEIFLG